MRISDWSSGVCSSDLIDRQLRPVGGVDAQPADDQIALRHRIDLAVGAIERGEDEGAATQAFRLADRGHRDVEALAGLGERRQVGGYHYRRGVLERRIDPRRQRQAKARYLSLHAERRIVEAGVAGRSEENTSEPQTLMRSSYAGFSLKKQSYVPTTKSE